MKEEPKSSSLGEQSKSLSARDVAAVVAFAAVLSFGFLAAELFVIGELGFPLDDTWIHLQFARNLAAGDGLSYQGGEAVAGSTAPLWTALLAFGAWSTSFGIVWAKLLGMTLHLVGVGLLLSLATSWGLGRWASLLVGVLYASTRWTLWSALSGMEIPLFVVLSLLGIRRHVLDLQQGESRFPWATLWLALASLARPEGLLLLLLSWGERLLRLRPQGDELTITAREHARRLPWHVALAALVIAPVAIYNMRASGKAIPTTLAAKSDAPMQLLPSLRDLWEMGIVFFPAQPWMTLLLGAGLFAALRTPERSLLPAVWPLALPAAFSVLGGDLHHLNHGRYLFPLFPFVCLLGVRALDDLSNAMAGRRLFGVRLRHVVALMLLLPAVWSLRDGLDHYVNNVANVTDTDVAVARWAAANLPPDARLAVQDIGAIGYLAPQPLVDMAGIVTPEILPYLRGDLRGTHPSGLGGWASFIEQQGVDFVVVFPASFRGGMQAIDSVMPGARLVHSITIENNITVIGSELVVLATPWGRAARPPTPLRP